MYAVQQLHNFHSKAKQAASLVSQLYFSLFPGEKNSAGLQD